jgi:hypothetical protein
MCPRLKVTAMPASKFRPLNQACERLGASLHADDPSLAPLRFDRYQEADVTAYGKTGMGPHDHLFPDF